MKTSNTSKNWHAIILVFALASCDLQIEQETLPQEDLISIINEPTFIPDKYIVVLKDETLHFRKTDKYEAVQAGMRIISNDLAARHGIPSNKVDKVYGNVISGFSVEMTSEQARIMAEDPTVAFIEPDGYAYGSDVVQTNATWGLDRINQTELPLDQEYTYNSPGSDITAFILDSGIRYDHEEFEGRAVPGFDFYGGNASDVYGHGTHVAGTVGGKIYGMAKKVKLVSVKVLGDDNRGSWSNIIGGIDWASANKTGPSVINMSIQGTSFGSAVSNAVKAAFNNGIVVVVAAGNWNDNACFQALASVPEAISVGASTMTDSRAFFSNFGDCIDIFAPGVEITSASVNGPDEYIDFQGTSMAAPHVAGAAVLYLSKNPEATPQEVTDYLMENSTKGIISNSLSANNNLLYTGKKIKIK
ncbi:S8 family peptidase [Algoriphagus zhangzhouensis]|uniref:Peptidase inhibitor I9 n=1 Tax=Algoriphagus zhangzhouensis TaxID=1073327 RepID=A0A1M7ZJ57_9BACT|nr:S8 family peptidase [Algoriphagus zhangzhouensis]TDY43617.1 peptidase inhibitor I9 [Algoriphagus zhangzhouensis]SHO64923.1 Peptidase inhibitor I9 [Algoriphagus zhangzhouensis]